MTAHQLPDAIRAGTWTATEQEDGSFVVRAVPAPKSEARDRAEKFVDDAQGPGTVAFHYPDPKCWLWLTYTSEPPGWTLEKIRELLTAELDAHADAVLENGFNLLHIGKCPQWALDIVRGLKSDAEGKA